jgi:hypothetical protein
MTSDPDLTDSEVHIVLRGGDTPRGQRRLPCRLKCGSRNHPAASATFDWPGTLVGPASHQPDPGEPTQPIPKVFA